MRPGRGPRWRPWHHGSRRRPSGRDGPRSGFRRCDALSGGFLRAGNYIDPLRVRRGLGVVVVVPVPPLVRRGLRIAFRRVLPSLLTAERCYVEIVPDGPHLLVAAIVDEVGAEDAVAVADEHVVAVPFAHAEVGVQAVGDCVPRHLPPPPRLHALDLPLLRTPL